MVEHVKEKILARPTAWIVVLVFSVLLIAAVIGYLVVLLLMGEVTGGSIASALGCVCGGLAGVILAVSVLRASRSAP